MSCDQLTSIFPCFPISSHLKRVSVYKPCLVFVVIHEISNKFYESQQKQHTVRKMRNIYLKQLGCRFDFQKYQTF